jgi:thiamine transport system permease protein
MDRRVDGVGARVNQSPSRQPRWLIFSLAIIPIIGLGVFFLWPFLTLLTEAITGEAITNTLTRRSTWEIAWFTLWQATVSTVGTIVIGLTPAYVFARYKFHGRELLVGLLTAIFVLPTVVMGAAFLALLPTSLDRTIWAVLGAHVVFNLAVVIRVVGTMWEHLPTDMEAAAATLGANRWRVFTDISFPLIRPAVTAAAAIVFLFTFTSFGVIRVLGATGTRTIEVEIWRRTTQLGELSEAAVLALLQLGVLALVVLWSTFTQRRHSRALRLEPLSPRRAPRSRGERRFVAIVAGCTAVVASVPLIALAVRSFSTPSGWSTTAWTNLGQTEIRPGIRLGIDPVDALGNSLRTAVWATLIAVVVGGVAALAIAAAGRSGRFLDTGLMLPLGASAVTIGFGMLITFDADPFDWRASWWLVPVGHALIAVPFVVRTALGPLRSVDPAMTEAAATLGAAPARAWREVVVPYLWRPLAVGAALAAAISLGEFGATSFLSRSGGETLPIAIEQLLGRTGSLLQAQGYVLATMLALTTVVLVAIVDRLRDPSQNEAERS